MAAYPPPAAGEHLARQLDRLAVMAAANRGVNTRPARPETWHVTLAFLGEVAEERAGRVPAAIQRAVDGWRDAATGAPELALTGGGTFGRGRFTVLWVGVDGDRELLGRLSRLVRRELRRDRLPYDDKPFRPHLTVARPGDRLDRAAVGADRAALAGYRGPTWRVESVELVRSHLGPRPRYEHLAGWRLVGPSEPDRVDPA